MSHDFVVLSNAGVLASGSGKWYTPVTVGDGGRHAGASRGAEVVARFESARVEPLDSVSGGDDPRVGDAVACSALDLHRMLNTFMCIAAMGGSSFAV